MAAGRGGAGGGGMAFGFAPGLKLGAPCYLLHALVSCWCTSEGAIPNISTLGGQLVSDHSVREMEVTAEICLPLLQHHFLVRYQLRRRVLQGGAVLPHRRQHHFLDRTPYEDQDRTNPIKRQYFVFLLCYND